MTPGNLVKRAWRAVLGALPTRATERIFRSWVSVVGSRADPHAALAELFGLADHVERELDIAAIRLDEGVHAKHRLTRYHDFFVERIRRGERVLDLGCGKGELAYDIALRAGADVVAVDRKHASLDFARARFVHPKLRFVEGDVNAELPPGAFDVVVLSNVLEHLEQRVELLHRIAGQLRPSRILLRVPAEDRHWHVPLRRELGISWFSDPSHVVEYDRERLATELEEAGLEVAELRACWGELWAEARPRRDG